MINSNNLSSLKDLLCYLYEIDMKYRKKIGLNKDTTFGIEIEFENLGYSEIEDEIFQPITPSYIKKFDTLPLINKYDNWSYKRETYNNSYDDNDGCEIVSKILADNKKSWDDIIDTCYFLRSNNAKITDNCGGHIHIGAHLFKSCQEYQTLIKLWAVYEPIIYRFSYGKKILPRKGISDYAKSIRFSNLKDINSLKDYIICFVYLKKPIEELES